MTRRYTPTNIQIDLDVCIGKAGHLVGHLNYHKTGPREYSTFAYDDTWLERPDAFEISPDLPLGRAYQTRRATPGNAAFFLALSDTEPDAWGRRVIARAHAKQRKGNPDLKALIELDYLCAVDDFSRVGALRLRNPKGPFLRTVENGRRATPALLELEHVLSASRAFELSEETESDLKYLLGKGTSLGGMRPKCTVLDEDGALALAKFPSVNDTRSVTRGEVLALRLAALAGIDAADARIVIVQNTPVALIRRFDRTADESRIPYLSGTSVLQAQREDERAYTEIVDAMRARCAAPVADARQLWRRIAFNHLITNVDDHLQNIGFLYVGRSQWRLAPAFDLNPFPDKDNESKTWLTEATGPIASVRELISEARYFNLNAAQARTTLGEIVAAVDAWRTVALSQEVGMTAAELDAFAPAFEGRAIGEAKQVLV